MFRSPLSFRWPLVMMMLGALGRAQAQMPGEGFWPAWDAPTLLRAQQHAGWPGSSGLGDATQGVVLLNGQCTGAFVSREGLLLTNHHCLLDALDHASRSGEDLLRDGFWANARSQERKLDGVSIAILRRAIPLDSLLAPGESPSPELLRRIEDGLNLPPWQQAVHKAFDAGSRHVLFVKETHDDVRLAGLPPERVARLGGESSYGKWPMVAADFALLRVYAQNYAGGVEPMQPSHHFRPAQEALAGGQALSVVGYPGHSDLYQSSWGLRGLTDHTMPIQIGMGAAARDVLSSQMGRSRVVEREYGSVYRALNISGRNLSVVHASLIAQDLTGRAAIEEARFLANASPAQVQEGLRLFEEMARLQPAQARLQAQSLAVRLLLDWSAPLRLARASTELSRPAIGRNGEALWGHALKQVRAQARRHFRTDHPDTDLRMLSALARAAAAVLPPEASHTGLCRAEADDLPAWTRWAQRLYARSAFGSEERTLALLEGLSPNHSAALERDPAVRLVVALGHWHDAAIAPELDSLQQRMRALQRAYLALVHQSKPGRIHYPDANGTLRVGYGRVAAHPGTGTWASTWADMRAVAQAGGVALPDALLRAAEARGLQSAGPCFLAAVHTSNGNSGSPVLDAQGRLLGINMARTEAGWVSDYHYDPAQVRAVVLDIRHVLLVTETLGAGSGLLEELRGS